MKGVRPECPVCGSVIHFNVDEKVKGTLVGSVSVVERKGVEVGKDSDEVALLREELKDAKGDLKAQKAKCSKYRGENKEMREELAEWKRRAKEPVNE